MFTRLLVPLDGSPLAESALAHAAALARPDASITLVNVLVPEAGAPPVDPLEWRLRRDAAGLYLDRVADTLRSLLGMTVSTVVAEGNAAERILALAREHDVELIVMASHGAGGPSPWNVNSVAFKVALRAGVSLLLVRGYRPAASWGEVDWNPQHYRRILVPLDGSLRGEHVIPAVSRLLGRHVAQLELAHVVAVPEAIERYPGMERAEDDAGDEARERAQRYLDEIGRDCGAQAGVTVHVLRNHDEFSILEDLVDQQQVDLVVLSAHGHSARRRRVHGSLTTSFLLHGATSLLILQDLPWHELQPGAAEQAVGTPDPPMMRAPGGHLPDHGPATQG